jgi:methyl-accepting chemotaxis protein
VKNWSLNAKISLVVGLLVLTSFGVAGLGLSKMSQINDSLEGIVTGPADRLNRAHELKELFLIQQINQKNFILEDTKDGMKKVAEKIAERDGQLKEKLESYIQVARPAAKPKLLEFREINKDWLAATERLMALASEDKTEEATKISVGIGRELRFKGEKLMDELVEMNKDFMKENADAADVDYADARKLMLSFSLIAIFISLALAYVTLRSLSRAIDQVIAQLTDNSNQVTSAAQQIASSSEELSQATTEQASSLEETASSIEEMNSMVKKSSDNADRSATLAEGSGASAARGKRVVTEVIQAIGEIDSSNTEMMKQINDSNHQIGEIVKVISAIGEKTKVINDIVFQTKLLSFNASVEAARAGEHGKGFAVVAEEVGNLAQMSGNAAKEISSMLDSSIQRVENIVAETKSRAESLMITGKQKVEAGTSVAKECGEVLDEIVTNVQTVKEMSTQIASACREQSQGVQEITKAMATLDQVTQTNAATSEEAASAAEELSAQADALRGVVGVLVATVKGGGTASAAAAPASPARSSNVRPIKSARSASRAFSPTSFKQAAGAELSVPSEADPRFEDV